MISRLILIGIILITLFSFVSCARMSKRMPEEIDQMHDFLTKGSPAPCQKYHYNFEREAPRLYEENQPDSLLDVIDFIKSECGPASNLEITQTLVMADAGRFDDSLIGSSTIPQMLWYRGERDDLMRWNLFSSRYHYPMAKDNTHDRFNRFNTDLAKKIAANNELGASEHAIGQFYAGQFDSAFASIQSKPMRSSQLRKSYDRYIKRVKDQFITRSNVALLVGNWQPQGNNDVLGNHPEVAIYLGGEGRRWRFDCLVGHRFSSAKNKFKVDSLGHIIETDAFYSWNFAFETGYKFVENSFFSTDIFVGVGIESILSVKEEGDHDPHINHGSPVASIGLRQRFFLNQRSGLYLGGIVKYTTASYDNPGGTSLSGNTLSIGVLLGWSSHVTLHQFLTKLNYKGNWRP